MTEDPASRFYMAGVIAVGEVLARSEAHETWFDAQTHGELDLTFVWTDHEPARGGKIRVLRKRRPHPLVTYSRVSSSRAMRRQPGPRFWADVIGFYEEAFRLIGERLGLPPVPAMPSVEEALPFFHPMDDDLGTPPIAVGR